MYKFSASVNSALRRIFGPLVNTKYNIRTIKLYDDELYSYYSFPNNIRVTKSGGTIWVVHVARIGDKFKQNTTVGVYERIIFKCTLKKQNAPYGLDYTGPR